MWLSEKFQNRIRNRIKNRNKNSIENRIENITENKIKKFPGIRTGTKGPPPARALLCPRGGL